MKPLTIKARFRIGAAVILLLMCTSVAVMVYFYLKNLATEHIYKETEIFIGAADATRTYVKDVLRPEVAALLPRDGFVPQAMSTSFVGREVMKRLRRRFPEFLYKRAASNPMNPINQADELETKMLRWFEENEEKREWHGLIRKDKRAFYARFRAIHAEAECLRCHGDPADAPSQMKAIYGDTGGYYYREGDVVAADTIYIPVDVFFVRAKEAAWNVFIIAAVTLFTLLGLFYLLFNRTVIHEMKGLLARFHWIHDHIEPPGPELPGKGEDEFQQVKQAFEQTAVSLKQTHDDLEASESKYRMLFETSRDAILICDHRTRLLDVNAAGCSLFGFENRAEALSIETLRQLFRYSRDADALMKRIGDEEWVEDLEVEMVDRRGRPLTAMISATRRMDERGALEGIDIRLTDVTGRRELEQRMARAEKMASIGQLASGVAHEINNPLGVIQLYANLIAKSEATDGQIHEDIRIIRKHTDQCKNVVEALLDFARASKPRKSLVRPFEGIDEVLALLEPRIRSEKIEVERRHGPDIPRIPADEAQLKQVFMNLLLNAIQAMPRGGRLSIGGEWDAAAGRIRVFVADTGEGISPGRMNRIFDPFFTTKEQGRGTGLGLAVSYGIIKQHGGEITAASPPEGQEKGSLFTVILPVDGGPGFEGGNP